MRLTIRGKPWNVYDADLPSRADEITLGLCHLTERWIGLQHGQKPKVRLNTLIHELLHAAKPKMSHRNVNAIAAILTDGIWNDKWRQKVKNVT